VCQNTRACAPFSGELAGSPSNTVSPGPRTTSVPSGILINPAISPQQTWAENWGLCPHPFWGKLGPHLTQCRLDQRLPSYIKWHIDQCNIFCTIHGPKSGRLGRDGFPSNTMSPGPRPTFVPIKYTINPAVWQQQIWAENWGCAPFWGELGPHLTQCGRSRVLPPCQVSS